MSIARRAFPSRLELKRRAGSFRDARLAKVTFTTFALQSSPETTYKKSRAELSASILQAFLRARAGTGVRPTGRRCSSGRHSRSNCPLLGPWGASSGSVIEVRTLGGQLHARCHDMRDRAACFPPARASPWLGLAHGQRVP